MLLVSYFVAIFAPLISDDITQNISGFTYIFPFAIFYAYATLFPRFPPPLPLGRIVSYSAEPSTYLHSVLLRREEV
jgi:hypothetical protein